MLVISKATVSEQVVDFVGGEILQGVRLVGGVTRAHIRRESGRVCGEQEERLGADARPRARRLWCRLSTGGREKLQGAAEHTKGRGVDPGRLQGSGIHLRHVLVQFLVALARVGVCVGGVRDLSREGARGTEGSGEGSAVWERMRRLRCWPRLAAGCSQITQRPSVQLSGTGRKCPPRRPRPSRRRGKATHVVVVAVVPASGHPAVDA